MSSNASANSRPLCVDLDGTLVASDTLWEALLLLLKKRPFQLLHVTSWLSKGRAIFKSQVAQSVELNPASLPYRANVLSFLQQEKASGREIILATASDQRVARSIADHLGIFSAVLASNGHVNLSGREKLTAVERHVGAKEFDYIGNSSVDLHVWKSAKESILVGPSSRLLEQARRVASVGRVFPQERNRFRTVLRALRMQQWVKNLLLLVPLITSHKITEPALVWQTLCAFVAFGLCASSVYVTNDLLDLESDRQHARKKNRPFACGALQIKTGIVLAPILLFAGMVFSTLFLPPLFLAAVASYFVISTAYSFYLKRLAAVDVIVLAALYTLRILAGGLATGVTLSPWILAFSLFLFLNLAFVKRYVELIHWQEKDKQMVAGRGYAVIDVELIRSFGTASGYLSVLVLALYLNSQDVLALYRHPDFLWFVSLGLLYWITRLWIIAHRGGMVDDPILFIFKDRVSYAVGGIIVILMLIAKF